VLGSLKEASAFGGIVAELVAEDAQGAGGVGEATSNLRARELLDEVSAEGFVLAVEGDFRDKEELGVRVSSYLITRIVDHYASILYREVDVNL
jgi:hypothetical protein